MADTSKRDANRVTTALGKDNSDGSTRYILIDHVTGYVLVDILSATSVIPNSVLGDVDDNRVTTARGKNNSTAVAQGILTDNRNGRVWCQMT